MGTEGQRGVESGEGEGGDVAVRQPVVPHPAKFSPTIIHAIGDALLVHLPPGGVKEVLDPFAGVGTLQQLHQWAPWWSVYCIELEEEWARQSPSLERVVVEDSLRLMGLLASAPPDSIVPFRNGWGKRVDLPSRFDAIVTSPAYGNRMADSHTPSPSDTSKRHTYRHYLGRKLSANNAGGMQWGRAYRDFHRAAWTQAVRVLKPGGLFVLNVSDHIRAGRIQPVSIWHEAQLRASGLELVERIEVKTPRMGHGQNGKVRVECEWVLVFRKKA
jgi:hypothetical protein